MSKKNDLRMSDAFYDQIQVLRYALDDMRRPDPQACSRAIARTMANNLRLMIEEIASKLEGEKP